MSDSWAALYVAYSLVWIGVFAYLGYIYLKQRSMQKDIASLSELVKKNAKQ